MSNLSLMINFNLHKFIYSFFINKYVKILLILLMLVVYILF